MIHNHGTKQCAGLACRETHRLDGTLRGACLPREKWTLVGRVTVNGKDWYVWGSQDRPERWVCPVRELIGETVTHGQA